MIKTNYLRARHHHHLAYHRYDYATALCYSRTSTRRASLGAAVSKKMTYGFSTLKSFPTDTITVSRSPPSPDFTTSLNLPPCISTLSCMCPCNVTAGACVSIARLIAIDPTRSPLCVKSPIESRGGGCSTHIAGGFFSFLSSAHDAISLSNTASIDVVAAASAVTGSSHRLIPPSSPGAETNPQRTGLHLLLRVQRDEPFPDPRSI